MATTTLQDIIADQVTKRMEFIARNRERLVEAFIAETGCKPSEAELVEVRDLNQTRIFIRPRTQSGWESFVSSGAAKRMEARDALTTQLKCAETEIAELKANLAASEQQVKRWRQRLISSDHEQETIAREWKERAERAELEVASQKMLVRSLKGRVERAEAECAALRSKFDARADETASGMANGKLSTACKWSACGHPRQVVAGCILPCAHLSCADSIIGERMIWIDGVYQRVAGQDGFEWVKRP